MDASSSKDVKRSWIKPHGHEGFWIVIVGDLVMFLIYFLVFSIGRLEDPATFDAGRRQLEPLLASVNTLILLTSSWFVARAVVKARGDHAKAAIRNLVPAILLGATFVVLKIVSYAIDLSHFAIDSNIFFSYYFAITGIHCVHVIIGTVLLAYIAIRIKRALDDDTVVLTETIGLFWHMVDLLWVIIFPMMYLLGGIA